MSASGKANLLCSSDYFAGLSHRSQTLQLRIPLLCVAFRGSTRFVAANLLVFVASIAASLCWTRFFLVIDARFFMRRG